MPPVKRIPRFDASMSAKNHAMKTTFILQLRNRFHALTVEENGGEAEDDVQCCGIPRGNKTLDYK